ncbi:phosphatidylserine/phosphatidylglycerophosphate/cardiolipin synthase family protein [Altererythrobacter sp.]|nr:phosphatidylserine/phosphatidylglycerophosphate/cardiolipin synthase family protein [Altererythrobacter sp.]
MPTDAAPAQYTYPEPFALSSQEHEFFFMPDGVHRFDALLELIDNAQESLNLFYYMFQDDDAGRPVMARLVEAAKRGVETHLLVDRFGTDATDGFFQPLIDAGGTFCIFNPKKSRRYLIRNHQKMAIADEKDALVGGFNVSEHYFNPPEENGWCDLGVKVRGPVVDDLLKWFKQMADWTENPKAQYRSVRKMVREWDPGDGKVRMLVGGPTRAPSNWARQVKSDMANAKAFDLVMAYFSPPRSFRRLIHRIGERGKARLVMAGKSDNGVTINAARAIYGAMIRHDVKVYEFTPCKLHMKLLVIDDAVYFGSANFDHRSIRLNLELMFRVEDAELAGKIREFIDGLADASLHVTHEVHRKRRGLIAKAKWVTAWFLATTVDYTVSRSLNVPAKGND